MRNSAVDREESKKPTQASDFLLEACPVQTLSGLNNIPLYIAGMNRPERDFHRFKVIQEAPGYISAVLDSRCSKPAHFMQVVRILIG